MKRIVMHKMGSQMPVKVKALKTDLPLLAITSSRHFINYFIEAGFEEVKSPSAGLPPLGVISNLKFKRVEGCRIVALSERMLGTTQSNFSQEFRKSRAEKFLIATQIDPLKTYHIFRNLGLVPEVFSNYRDWVERYTIFAEHPVFRYPMIKGPKNLEELISKIRPYIQEDHT